MADESPTSPSGGAAEAPAPAETPVSTPSPSSAPDAQFDGLGQDYDDAEVEIDLSPLGDGKPPEPAETAAPATPEPAKPPPKPAPAPPPPAPPVAPAPPEGPKEQPSATASPPSEPRTLVEQLHQHRGDILNELAKTRFAWDPGEQKQFTEALEQDASQTLVDWVPKLMSRLYYESATMALNHINQFVPVLLNNYTKAMEAQKAAEGDFFKQFPQLDRVKHWNDIVQFASVFNRQNPAVSQADLLALVGAAVLAKNKIAVGAPVNGGQPPPPRKPSTPPFVPAQAGGSPARVVTEPENAYAGLGGVYDED